MNILLGDKIKEDNTNLKPYALCEKALGRAFPKKETEPAVSSVATEKTAEVVAPAPEPISFKDQFKRDLLNSLSKALSE